MFTGISIYDAVNAVKNKLAKAKEERSNRKAARAAEEAEEEYEEEKDKDIVITQTASQKSLKQKKNLSLNPF